MTFKSREKKAFLENKKLHGLSADEIATKFGVSNSTARKWMQAAGIDTSRASMIRTKHAKRAMCEDRYLISAGGISLYTLPKLAEMYAVSTCTIGKILKEMGIKPHGMPTPRWSDTQPKISKKAKFVCQQMQAWSRTGKEAQ